MIHTLAADAIVSDSLISQGGPFVIVAVVLSSIAFAMWKAVFQPAGATQLEISKNNVITTQNILSTAQCQKENSTKQELVLARLHELYDVKRAKMDRDALHQT